MLYQLSYARAKPILAGCEPMLRERRRALPAAVNEDVGCANCEGGGSRGNHGFTRVTSR
jgi:hypothetical protein